MARLEGQLHISTAEARKISAELQTVMRVNDERDEMLHRLQEENSTLKEKNEQNQSQLREVKKSILEIRILVSDLPIFLLT